MTSTRRRQSYRSAIGWLRRRRRIDVTRGLYGAAALAVATMDTSQLDAQVRSAIAYLACNVARSIAFALIDEWVVDAIDNVLGVAGASNPTSCPG